MTNIQSQAFYQFTITYLFIKRNKSYRIVKIITIFASDKNGRLGLLLVVDHKTFFVHFAQRLVQIGHFSKALLGCVVFAAIVHVQKTKNKIGNRKLFVVIWKTMGLVAEKALDVSFTSIVDLVLQRHFVNVSSTSSFSTRKNTRIVVYLIATCSLSYSLALW